MSGDKLFGGMHDDVNRAITHTAHFVCLVELVTNGPFMEKQVPEEDPDGFDKAGINRLIEQGEAIRITVRGRQGFIAATDKGMDTYLSRMDIEPGQGKG